MSALVSGGACRHFKKIGRSDWHAGHCRRRRSTPPWQSPPLGGIAINLLALAPMKALYWSAIDNGIVAVPMLSMMMLVASHPGVMGEFTIGRRLAIVGWIATIIMASSVIGMVMAALP